MLVDRFNISLSAPPSRVKIRINTLDDLRSVYITHLTLLHATEIGLLGFYDVLTQLILVKSKK